MAKFHSHFFILKKKLFDLPPKDFECLCFVHILEKEHDKLDPQAF